MSETPFPEEAKHYSPRLSESPECISGFDHVEECIRCGEKCGAVLKSNPLIEGSVREEIKVVGTIRYATGRCYFIDEKDNRWLLGSGGREILCLGCPPIMPEFALYPKSKEYIHE